MSRIKILLVDDEENALSLLESLLENHKQVEVVGKSTTKIDAIRKMIEHQPDVIFQDIQMYGVSGLDLVDEYKKHNFHGKIVFITAFAEYAIDAIKKAAFDYLLKPVDKGDLDDLILRLMSDKKSFSGIGAPVQKKLKIPTRQGFSLLNIKDIIYCEADGNYTTIVSQNRESVTTATNLGKVEKDLNQPIFFRINRSVIINTDFLITINKGEKTCRMKSSKSEFDFNISSGKIRKLEEAL